MAPPKKIAVTMLIMLIVIQGWILTGLMETGYSDFIPNVAAMMVLWIAFTCIELRYKLYMHNYVRTVTMLATLCDNLIGHYLNYYLTSNIFDKMLHAFGTYSLALFAYVLVAQGLKNPFPRCFKFILVVSLGISIGALYEIGEFAADQLLKPGHPSQPSLWDTDLDLIADVVGAMTAGLHIAYFHFLEREIPCRMNTGK